ncbi:helicase associated domain-containing protein [Streptomyces sp. LUP47B]|uniref:helicase associated domain-containing protein n=1 Tax=Streptomyces sp. LUP47B TaxID=1890286 RepID=UPI0035224F9B
MSGVPGWLGRLGAGRHSLNCVHDHLLLEHSPSTLQSTFSPQLRQDHPTCRTAGQTAEQGPEPVAIHLRHRRVNGATTVRPHSRLPDIQPGVQFEEDDLGKWPHRQRRSWAELSEEQQQRLTALGATPAEPPASPATPPTPPTRRCWRSAARRRPSLWPGTCGCGISSGRSRRA